MTDTAAEGPSPEPPPRRRFVLARLADAVRRQDWFTVLVEIAVVVLGVVIGFQVTAWGQARADRAQEQAYLRQLAGDLRETERQIALVDSVYVPIDAAAVSFVRAYYRADRPPAESLLVWRHRANWYFVFRPVVSTAEALVATGDLTLIRNDSLRTAVTAYLENMEIEANTQESIGEMAARAIERLDDQLPFAEARRAAEGDARIDSLARADPLYLLPEGPLRRPFPADLDALYENREVLSAAERFATAKSILTRSRRWILAETQTLLRRVEAEIER